MTPYIVIGLLIFVLSFNYSANEEDAVDRRIVGGFRTYIGIFPHQASIRRRGRHFCGGSVISEEWILTAAHCLVAVQNKEGNLTVHLGTSNRTNSGKIHKIEEIHMHPSYNPKNFDYDFALLKLEKPIEYSRFIQPIELAGPEDNLEEGMTFSVSGWGKSEVEKMSTHLLAVKVPYVDPETCNKRYRGKITERMFCAGYVGLGGKDSCQGDSGGPVVESEIQYGVVSWGTGCGKAGFPGVYAKVSDQRDWIKEVSGV